MNAPQTTLKPRVEYDPVAKRWKADCPRCGRVVARAKRESAEHNMAQHIAYQLCPKDGQ